MSKATSTKTKNGKAAKRPPRKRKQAVPQLSEKTIRLTLKAFRKTYEAHQSAEMISRVAPTKTKNGNAQKRPTRKRKQAAPELPEKTRKLILKGFRLAYEAHHGKSS